MAVQLADSKTSMQNDKFMPYLGSTKQKTIRLLGIPEHWNEWHAFHLITQYGRVENITISDHGSKAANSSRCASVQMLTIADVEKVYKNLQKENTRSITLADGTTVFPIFHPAISNPCDQTTDLSDYSEEDVNKRESDKRNKSKKAYSIWKSGIDIYEKIYYVENLPFGALAEVSLISFEDDEWPVVIGVHLKYQMDGMTVTQKSLEEMNSRIKKSCINSVPLTSVKVNSLVALKIGKKTMVRGKVLKILNDETTLVYKVDYGKTTTVKISKLKPLDPEFVRIPFQAIKCTLHGISGPTKNFRKAFLDEWKRSDRMFAKLIGYLGSLRIVKLFDENENPENDILLNLATQGACLYNPEMERIQYSKSFMLSVRDKYEVSSYLHGNDISSQLSSLSISPSSDFHGNDISSQLNSLSISPSSSSDN